MVELTRRAFALAAAAIPSGEWITLLAGPKPLTWLFTGDSITHGAAHTNGWRSYPEHFAERLRWELRRPRDIVINTGSSGDRLPKMLTDLESRVLRFKPDVVSLKFGMNDCLASAAGHSPFREALPDVYQKVTAAGALVILHTPNLIYYPADPARQDLLAYVEIIREFAADRKLTLIDHYAHWSKTRTPQHKLLALLADGAIHPNQYGHIVLFHLLLRELGLYDPQSATGRLFVPYGSLTPLS